MCRLAVAFCVSPRIDTRPIFQQIEQRHRERVFFDFGSVGFRDMAGLNPAWQVESLPRGQSAYRNGASGGHMFQVGMQSAIAES